MVFDKAAKSLVYFLRSGLLVLPQLYTNDIATKGLDVFESLDYSLVGAFVVFE